jgi:acyl carrier protein
MDRIATLKRILTAQLGPGYPPAHFRPDTPLLGTIPELDSMAVAGILTSIEEAFGVGVEDDAVSAEIFGTFGALADFVASLRDAW